MQKAAGWMTFLFTMLWAGLAFAQKNPGGQGGGAAPEPSMLLYALSGVLPAWWIFRRK
jgi:hypothetical protein